VVLQRFNFNLIRKVNMAVYTGIKLFIELNYCNII
jgi:uncharacterized protein YaaN involved in tellurite resistance